MAQNEETIVRSSQSSSSSESEGEYVVEENKSFESSSSSKTFDFSVFGPKDFNAGGLNSSFQVEENKSFESSSSSKTPDFSVFCPKDFNAGLNYISVLPWLNSTDLNYAQKEHLDKIKVSKQHRTTRRRHYATSSSLSRNSYDNKRLRIAADKDDFDTVCNLLESGADVNSIDDKQRSALHFAASRGNKRIVCLLLDYGADANVKDFIGNTPLHLAACISHIDTVTALLKGGTNVCAEDSNGNTPLTLARSRLKMLCEKESYSNTQRKNELAAVVGMLKEFMLRTGNRQNFSQLDDLCFKLNNISTNEEIEQISSLLSNMTSLTLEPRDPR